VPLLLLGLALSALGCGGGASSAPATSTAAAKVTAFTWLRDKAEPWNHALNRDQRNVNAAAGATTGTSQFFSHLSAACSSMLADTRKAQAIAPAPATSLQHAWAGMLAGTATYASNCLTLAHSHANQDLTAWNNSLASMNQASGVWNTAVNATRNGPHSSVG
jgi:hypothetical protein